MRRDACLKRGPSYFTGTRCFSSSKQGRTTGRVFIGFRELMSARGNVLLKLSKPVEHYVDLQSAVAIELSLRGVDDPNESAIQSEVVGSPIGVPHTIRERHRQLFWLAEREAAVRRYGCGQKLACGEPAEEE